MNVVLGAYAFERVFGFSVHQAEKNTKVVLEKRWCVTLLELVSSILY